ncbi:DUF4214 domain-containing protein [Pseudoduganella buxea]|nr:DUF4214 domain-containing protein [Pseudoduganella buxea]GGC07150.1 hypothetical protein GCM10011572_30930 [Pseudoduganella buxea]
MAQTPTEAVQQLYLAYFNRPAEPGGLKFWVDAITKNGGSLKDISTAFSKTPEYQAQFDRLTPEQIVTKIYDNLFNRAPDPTGLKYWAGHLASGALSPSYVVDAIASSAVDNPTVSPADTGAVNSKVKAAIAFTELTIADPVIAAAYGRQGAGEIAKAYLHGVVDATTLAAAVASLQTTTLARLLDMPPGAAYSAGVLTFAASPVLTVDGASLAHFPSIVFGQDSSIVNASQKLLAHGDLYATAAGYAVADGGAVTYRGDLQVSADRDANTLTLKGDTATVNVTATAASTGTLPAYDGDVHTTIDGDLRTSLTVNVVNAVDAKTATADTLASATITIVSGDSNSLAALKALKLAGNGSVTVDNSNDTGSTPGAATALATIDAGGLGGTLTVGARSGEITGGLTFTGNANVTEQITLGSGHDVLNLRSTYANMDAVAGFDRHKETDDLASTVDVMTFGGITIDGATANADIVKMSAAKDASLALAFVHAASVAPVGKLVQFTYENSTYLFADTGTTAGALDGDDAAVRIVGVTDFTVPFTPA